MDNDHPFGINPAKPLPSNPSRVTVVVVNGLGAALGEIGFVNPIESVSALATQVISLFTGKPLTASPRLFTVLGWDPVKEWLKVEYKR